MSFNLASKIMAYIAFNHGYLRGEVFSLSQMRRLYGIPHSTFHRHIKTLVDDGVLLHVGRDKYEVNFPPVLDEDGRKQQEFPF